MGVLFAVAGSFLAATVAPAFAATSSNTTVTATVSAGALSITSPATASVAVTLDGTDQTPTYSPILGANDQTGSGSGWNLTITSTQFTTGAPVHTLSTSASSLTGATMSCAGPGTCTNPTNSITYPVAVPAGAGPPSAVRFYNAAVNTGMGNFTITPTIGVSIPANTYAGVYTSTVTFSIVSGP
jgi:hypothetical protein